jgi:hypothetical protein
MLFTKRRLVSKTLEIIKPMSASVQSCTDVVQHTDIGF